MKVKYITDLIERFAPLSLQEDYDNAGLLCGNPDNEVTSILLTTDITEDVLDEAIVNGNNMIISHHPLMLKGIKNFSAETHIQKCIIKAIRNNLNIYSAHTNIDFIKNGVSGHMAQLIGLQDQEVLLSTEKLYSLTFYTPIEEASRVRETIFNVGAGFIGKYSHCSYNTTGEGTFKAHEGAHPFVGNINELHSEKEIRTEITVPEHLLNECIKTLRQVHPYEEPVWNIVCLKNTNPMTGYGIVGNLKSPVKSESFLHFLKTTFECDIIRHTAICTPTIQRVALCGGSGSFLLQHAISKKADIFITADYKYHDFFEAENKIIIADIGHYESEHFTKEIFYEILTKKIPNFVVQFSKVRTNPVYYL